MSMISFLNPPMFQKPDEIYSPLARFSATTDPPAQLEKEIQFSRYFPSLYKQCTESIRERS